MTLFAQGGGMHTLYALKPRFQSLLRPLARWLVVAGATANQITVLACCLSVGVGLLAFSSRRMLLLLPAFFVVRMALNALDGMLARDFGHGSNLGACLNEVADVVSDCFLYLPFARLPEFDPLWIGVVIVLAVITELAGITVLMIGAERRYDGPMGKSDRALVFGVMALWLAIGGSLAPWECQLFPIAIAVLLAVTIMNRVRGGLAEAALRSRSKVFRGGEG